MAMGENRPVQRLSLKTLTQALQAFVVLEVTRSHLVVSIRALWSTRPCDEMVTENLIPVKCRQLELILRDHKNMHLIVSSITGIEVKKSKKKREKRYKNQGHGEAGEEGNEDGVEEINVKPGVSFWMAIDAPSNSLHMVESQVGIDLEFDFASIEAYFVRIFPTRLNLTMHNAASPKCISSDVDQFALSRYHPASLWNLNSSFNLVDILLNSYHCMFFIPSLCH